MVIWSPTFRFLFQRGDTVIAKIEGQDIPGEVSEVYGPRGDQQLTIFTQNATIYIHSKDVYFNRPQEPVEGYSCECGWCGQEPDWRGDTYRSTTDGRYDTPDYDDAICPDCGKDVQTDVICLECESPINDDGACICCRPE